MSNHGCQRALALLCAGSLWLLPAPATGQRTDEAERLHAELDKLLDAVDRTVAETDEPVSGAESDEVEEVPLLVQVGREDARLVDLFAFTRDENLVLIVCLDPAIPPRVTDYRFSPDLTVQIHIDNDTEVRFDNSLHLNRFGGTIVQPTMIERDISFSWVFPENGTPRMFGRGLPASGASGLMMTAGARMDPFIRGGNSTGMIAALAVRLPLKHFLDDGQSTLLIWATATVDGLEGPFQSLAGRALRSRSSKSVRLDTLHPRSHKKTLGVPPDVIIFDTSRPAAFPNGRDILDDVVGVLGEVEVLADDVPARDPSGRALQESFPYLRPPHEAP